MRNKPLINRLLIWAVITGIILTLPYFAKWRWTAGDYLLGGLMLYGSASVYEILTDRVKTRQKKAVIGTVIVIILLFVWGFAATGFDS